MEELIGYAKPLAIFAIVLLVGGLLVGLVAMFWPVVLVIVAAVVGGIVYFKHRKRRQNLV